MTNLSIGDIIKSASIAPKKVEFRENSNTQYQDMIKIERKKKQKGKKKEKNQDLAKLLANAKTLDTKDALAIYESQSLAAG